MKLAISVLAKRNSVTFLTVTQGDRSLLALRFSFIVVNNIYYVTCNKSSIPKNIVEFIVGQFYILYFLSALFSIRDQICTVNMCRAPHANSY